MQNDNDPLGIARSIDFGVRRKYIIEVYGGYYLTEEYGTLTTSTVQAMSFNTREAALPFAAEFRKDFDKPAEVVMITRG